MKNETEQIIQTSSTADELLQRIEQLAQDDALEMMKPALQREVKRSVSQRSMGSSGIRGSYF